jgi:hypothetical protein
VLYYLKMCNNVTDITLTIWYVYFAECLTEELTSSLDAGPIAGGVSAVLLLLVVIVIVLVCVKR